MTDAPAARDALSFRELMDYTGEETDRWEAWLRASGWWERLPVRERPRFGHGVEGRLPDGTLVICSFHPSRQNTNTGKLTRAMWHDIFRRARTVVDE